MSNWYELEQQLRTDRESENAKAEHICREVYRQAAEAHKNGQPFPAKEWEKVRDAREAAVEKELAYIKHLKTTPPN